MSTNPYESPTAYSTGYGTGAPDRPVAGIVFGILNLLFGTLGICGIAFSSVMFFIPLDPDMVRQNPALQLMQDNQFYKLFMQASVVVGGVFTFVLIGSGIPCGFARAPGPRRLSPLDHRGPRLRRIPPPMPDGPR